MAKPHKINTGFRIDPAIINKLKELAQKTGQTETWWIENLLATALGLREWPKLPKSINKAKDFVASTNPKDWEQDEKNFIKEITK